MVQNLQKGEVCITEKPLSHHRLDSFKQYSSCYYYDFLPLSFYPSLVAVCYSAGNICGRLPTAVRKPQSMREKKKKPRQTLRSIYRRFFPFILYSAIWRWCVLTVSCTPLFATERFIDCAVCVGARLALCHTMRGVLVSCLGNWCLPGRVLHIQRMD